MKPKTSLTITGALLALSLIASTAAFAETQVSEGTMSDVRAFLSSPISMSQAISAAQSAAGGRVSSIEYQSGDCGAPDLIVANVVLADGTAKTVTINPADGKVMNVTLAESDQQGDEQDDCEDGGDGEQDGANANN